MSAGGIEAIVNGVVELAAIGAGTACFFRVADRLQITRGAAPQASAQPPPERPAAVPSAAISARHADRALREAAFAEHRGAGKSVAEAGTLAGIAGRTARTYEAKRRALNGAAAGGAS